jgi:hypothetical protein
MSKAAVLVASLAILIAVIAQDALMALDGHPASTAGGHAGLTALTTTAAHHQATWHEPSPASPAMPDAVACVVSRPATLPLGSGIDLPRAILPVPSLPVVTVTVRIPWQSAPGHPPAVCRALLQVYRN